MTIRETRICGRCNVHALHSRILNPNLSLFLQIICNDSQHIVGHCTGRHDESASSGHPERHGTPQERRGISNRDCAPRSSHGQPRVIACCRRNAVFEIRYAADECVFHTPFCTFISTAWTRCACLRVTRVYNMIFNRFRGAKTARSDLAGARLNVHIVLKIYIRYADTRAAMFSKRKKIRNVP